MGNRRELLHLMPLQVGTPNLVDVGHDLIQIDRVGVDDQILGRAY